ncbi:MAG: DUF3365 domain-containing protein [Bacteroidales bacterium]|nr:DUF3365 domain-containing protein [Bacteroidales bacterium]
MPRLFSRSALVVVTGCLAVAFAAQQWSEATAAPLDTEGRQLNREHRLRNRLRGAVQPSAPVIVEDTHYAAPVVVAAPVAEAAAPVAEAVPAAKVAPAAATPDKAAIERARATIKMMDDLHKGYVIIITETYVAAKEHIPAAVVAEKVFGHMEKNNHGTGRLIDASGAPLRRKNVAKSDFEIAAVKAIKGGKAYVDEVGTKDGKPVLRAATLVPAVMDACVDCHPKVKKGDVLGALVYEIPIQ